MLGKLPVPGHPTNLDYSRARAYCACLDIFSVIYHFFFLSPSLWETARYRLKYCLKGPLGPKQPTNQLKHIKDGLPDLFHSFRNKYFYKIALGSMLYFQNKFTSFEKMHGFLINMQ